jgi:hypothetical protein
MPEASHCEQKFCVVLSSISVDSGTKASESIWPEVTSFDKSSLSWLISSAKVIKQDNFALYTIFCEFCVKAFNFSSSDVLEVARKFQLADKFDLKTAKVVQNNVGHLNATFIISSKGIAPGYVLQCIDHQIFKNIPGLMGNIEKICAHLGRHPTPGQIAPSLIPTLSGDSFVKYQDNFWRMYQEVPGRVVERCTNPEIAYKAAKAFGAFDFSLAQLSISDFISTIPDFHNVPKRLKALDYVFGTDKHGRVRELDKERRFIDSWRERVDEIERGLVAKRLPLRLVHHDTKINNLIFDEHQNDPICVVDYDTCMPGVILSDVGDLSRYSLSDSAEDEPDLSKIKVRPEYFEAISRGFVDSMSAVLKPSEVLMFPIGVMLRTLCDGIRFLTDHIQGDVYFKISRPSQNLDRARTQFEIVRQMGELEPVLLKQVEPLSKQVKG